MAIVLVVEDEEQVRVLAGSYLQEHGHQTISAATVDEALAVLDVGDPIDLLFTDLGLKDDLQAGLKLAKTASERRPGLKVLYTTGQAITDGMKVMMVEGSALLPKPYTVDLLLSLLSERFGVGSGPQPRT
jgi:DNA-binding NtrC family response regulator